MPSVEPQVTVISRSGSYSSPRNQRVLSAMASRKSFAPQVTAYWLTSSLMAAAAARLRSSGAGKSGKPCERLTAPCLSASRVISRMTDSVKRPAFCETRRRLLTSGVAMGVPSFENVAAMLSQSPDAGQTAVRRRPLTRAARGCRNFAPYLINPFARKPRGQNTKQEMCANNEFSRRSQPDRPAEAGGVLRQSGHGLRRGAQLVARLHRAEARALQGSGRGRGFDVSRAGRA